MRLEHGVHGLFRGRECGILATLRGETRSGGGRPPTRRSPRDRAHHSRESQKLGGKITSFTGFIPRLPPSSYPRDMPPQIPLARAPGRPLGPWRGVGSNYTPGKLMWWHDAIIDEMLVNPHFTKKDIAAKLNCTPVFIYMITNSDLFAARWEQRRAEYSEGLNNAVLGKLTKVASKTLDRILDNIEDVGKQIPLNQLESLADKTLGRLGYGPKREPSPPPTQVHVSGASVQVVVPVTREELDAARRLIHDQEKALASQPRSGSALAAGMEAGEARLAEGFEPRPSVEIDGEAKPDGTFSLDGPQP
jgi:hypothetical protein